MHFPPLPPHPSVKVNLVFKLVAYVFSYLIRYLLGQADGYIAQHAF